MSLTDILNYLFSPNVNELSNQIASKIKELGDSSNAKIYNPFELAMNADAGGRANRMRNINEQIDSLSKQRESITGPSGETIYPTQGRFRTGVQAFDQLAKKKGIIPALGVALGHSVDLTKRRISEDISGGLDPRSGIIGKPLNALWGGEEALPQNNEDVTSKAQALVQDLARQPKQIDAQAILQAAGGKTPMFKVGPNDEVKSNRVSKYKDIYGTDETGAGTIRNKPIEKMGKEEVLQMIKDIAESQRLDKKGQFDKENNIIKALAVNGDFKTLKQYLATKQLPDN